MTGRRKVAIGAIFFTLVMGTVEVGAAASYGPVLIGGDDIDGGTWCLY